MTNFQNLMSNEIPRTKSQCPKREFLAFEVWDLELGHSLDIGAWTLGFPFGGVFLGEQAASKTAQWGSNPHAVARTRAACAT